LPRLRDVALKPWVRPKFWPQANRQGCTAGIWKGGALLSKIIEVPASRLEHQRRLRTARGDRAAKELERLAAALCSADAAHRIAPQLCATVGQMIWSALQLHFSGRVRCVGRTLVIAAAREYLRSQGPRSTQTTSPGSWNRWRQGEEPCTDQPTLPTRLLPSSRVTRRAPWQRLIRQPSLGPQSGEPREKRPRAIAHCRLLRLLLLRAPPRPQVPRAIKVQAFWTARRVPAAWLARRVPRFGGTSIGSRRS